MQKLTAILSTVCLLALAFGAGSPALAEEPQVGRGVICDTLEQAQGFIAAWDGTNGNEAVALVNGDLDPADGCGFAIFVYLVGEDLGETITSTGTWRFNEVAITGYCSPIGTCKPAEPELQYTAFMTAPPVVGTSI